MDSTQAIIVICLALVVIAVINLGIFATLRRGQRNEVGQIELMRRAIGSINQPWKKEDDALKELSQRVAEFKKKEQPHE